MLSVFTYVMCIVFYPISLHDALPIFAAIILVSVLSVLQLEKKTERSIVIIACYAIGMGAALTPIGEPLSTIVTGNLKDRKSTRLNSSHVAISYAVFCLKH